MNLEIKIVKGNDVLVLLNDKTIITQWEELANQDQKVTVIQEPPFVITWYHQYSNKFQPILILGFDNCSNMVGLMPLAFSLKDQYLTHAGDIQAEYNGWICKKSADEDFPIQALIAIKRDFQPKEWQWRWMPPKSQINWLSSSILKKENIYVKIIKQDSLILDLTDENKIRQLKNNKSLKTKINRYKKNNNFYLERIKSKEKALKVFDILAIQCDFRQMAVHQTTPFASDGNKKQFFIERLSFPESSHFTILWSENKPIAYHFGACDSDTVYLGLTSYDPLEEKNSPGSILFMKLIELLIVEGYHYFDLTPGRDKYKEKYSNLHQSLYKPSIYFCLKDKVIADLKHFMKEAIRNLILIAGAQPNIVMDNLNNGLDKLKKKPKTTLLIILGRLFALVYNRKVYILYRFLIDEDSLYSFQSGSSINMNNYSDLLLYNETNPWIRKTDILLKALRCFSLGELLYTVVNNGVLAHYGWMIRGEKTNRLPEINMEFEFPANSIILYGFFTDQNFDKREFYTKILESILIECGRSNAKEVFIWANVNTIPFGNEIENIGFKVYRKFQRLKIPGLVRMKEYL